MKKLFLFPLFSLSSSFAYAEQLSPRERCYYHLADIVRSSKNFPFILPVAAKTVNVLYDRDDDNTILLQLSVDKTPDEFDPETPNSTYPVGWALYDIVNEKLFALGPNEEDRTQIQFNKKYAKNFSKCLAK